METDKRQVVFVTRALWGGGAEKVVHDLAHGLAQRVFQPVVTYLFEQGGSLVSYSPSIPVYSLESRTEALCNANRLRQAIEIGQICSNRLKLGSWFSMLLFCLGRFWRLPSQAYWQLFTLLAETFRCRTRFRDMAAAVVGPSFARLH